MAITTVSKTVILSSSLGRPAKIIVTERNLVYNITMNTRDKYWLAGLLEGEGTFGFHKKPMITLEMTDKDVVERVSELFGTSVMFLPKRQDNWKDTYKVRVTGKKAVIIMMDIRHIMGSRRQGKIDEILSKYEPRKVLDKKTVDKIFALHEQGFNQTSIGVAVGFSRSLVGMVLTGKRGIVV